MWNWTNRKRQEESDLEKRINELNGLITSLEKQRANLIKDNNDMGERLKAIRRNIDGFGMLEEIGFERYVPTMYNSNIESKIAAYEEKLACMLADDMALIKTREYRIDGSEAKGRKFQANYGKNCMCGFNTYAQSRERSVTTANFGKTCKLICNSFEKFNRQGALLGISISEDYLNIRLELLRLKLELKEQKTRERELLRQEKARMREQEKLLEEIAKEEKRLEQERKSMDIAFNATLSDAEREEIRAKMAEVDKRLESLSYRRNHHNAGWLYVISSPSLPNMSKIGCTRRVNPTIRVSELSSSSLPYAFNAHGFVFSDNCFELEADIHRYFDDKRVAPNREFFYITPEEAIEVLETKFGQKVHSFYSPEILEDEGD